MADVTLSYEDSTIGELSESGTMTIKTAGKYCEDDIELVYEAPSGGISWDDIASQSVPTGDVILSVTAIADYAIYERRNSTEWKLYGPNVTSIGQSGVRNCSQLTEVHLPILSTTHSTGYSFYGNAKLVLVDYGVADTIRGNQFNASTALNTLILRKDDSLVSLANTNAFNGTCFKSGGSGGTIYIPAFLYNHLGDGGGYDYQSASNWSTVYGYGTITWTKIEGSVYEI